MLLEHAFRRHIAMKRPFCRPGLLWEYTITVSCHCLMPSPFMQDIQEGARRGVNAGWGGRPASGQRRIRESACKRPAQDKGKRPQEARAGWGNRLASNQRRMREDAWRGSRADREGVPDWRLTRREQGRFGLTAHRAGAGAIPIGEPRYLIGGILRSASALAFLLRSPFRSQLRQALHWARNR